MLFENREAMLEYGIVELASPMQRIGAAIATWCLWGIIIFAILFVMRIFLEPFPIVHLIAVLCVCAWILLGIPLVTMARRATWGMRWQKLRWFSNTGAQVSPLWCAARMFLGIITLPLFPLNIVMVLVDKHQRSIADHLCKTLVCLDQDVSI